MDFKRRVKRRFLIAFVWSGFLFGMAASPPLVGGPAPHFALETADGPKVRLADLKGQSIVLNFWATWCAPCTLEMPELQKAHQALKGKAAVIGINLAESRDRVKEFVHLHHVSFPLLLDTYGNVAQDYEVLHLPVTYFISPDGIIRDKVFGGGLTQKMIEDRIRQIETPPNPAAAEALNKLKARP